MQVQCVHLPCCCSLLDLYCLSILCALNAYKLNYVTDQITYSSHHLTFHRQSFSEEFLFLLNHLNSYKFVNDWLSHPSRPLVLTRLHNSTISF
jgi:hypothetical protein